MHFTEKFGKNQKLFVTVIILLTLSLALSIIPSTSAKGKLQPEFMVASDAHITGWDQDVWGSDIEGSQTQQNLINFINEVNKKEPDFAVITGDLVDFSNNEATIEEWHSEEWHSIEGKTLPYWNWAKVGEILSKSDVPIFVVTGNHAYYQWQPGDDHKEMLEYYEKFIALGDIPDDYSNYVTGEFSGLEEQAEKLGAQFEFHKKDPEKPPIDSNLDHKGSDWSFDYGPIHVVGLESGDDVDMDPQEILEKIAGVGEAPRSTGLDDDQIEWLEEDLEGENNIFIFMHHTWASSETEITAPDYQYNWKGSFDSNTSEFLDILKEHDVRGIYSGHLHDEREFTYEKEGAETGIYIADALKNSENAYKYEASIPGELNVSYYGDTSVEYSDYMNYAVNVNEFIEGKIQGEKVELKRYPGCLEGFEKNLDVNEEGIATYSEKITPEKNADFLPEGSNWVEYSYMGRGGKFSCNFYVEDDILIDYVGETEGHYLSSATLEAKVTSLDPHPFNGGLNVKFKLFKKSGKFDLQDEHVKTWTAFTNEDGLAEKTVNLPSSLKPGDYRVQAVIDDQYCELKSTVKEDFSIYEGEGELSYTGDSTAAYEGSAQFKVKGEVTNSKTGEVVGPITGEKVRVSLVEKDGKKAMYEVIPLNENGIASKWTTIDVPPGEYEMDVMLYKQTDFSAPTKHYTFTVTKKSTNIEYTGENIVEYSDDLNLKAQLSSSQFITADKQINEPLEGKEINFKIFKSVTRDGRSEQDLVDDWTATTNKDGIADKKVSLNLSPGSYTLQAHYDGGPNYEGSTYNGSLTVVKEHAEITYNGPLQGNKGEMVTLKAEFSESDSMEGDLSGKEIVFELGETEETTVEWTTTTTDGDGIAETSVIIDDEPGDYVIETRFKGDEYYHNASTIEVFEILEEDVKQSTILTYRGDTTGRYGDNATLSAVLEKKDTNERVSGKEVVFNIGGESWSTFTDEDGVAEIVDNLLEKPDDYLLTVDFYGDEQYEASDDQTTFSLEKNSTILVYMGDKSGTSDEQITLEAQLIENDGTPFTGQISGKPVTFELNGDSWTAYTDEYGVAEKTVLLNKTSGRYTMTAKFWGDDYYENSSDSTSFSVSN